MEWVETTAKTIEEAKSAALDQLGVAADEAEFEVLDEPRPGLFGRTRGEGRVRARIKPAQVRPKQERRRRGSKDKAKASTPAPSTEATESNKPEPDEKPQRAPRRRNDNNRNTSQEKNMSNDDRGPSPVSPEEVGDAAVTFMDGLASAFGASSESELEIDGTEIDLRVTGSDLGLLVGPGGRTLNAIQDLVRVSAQRRLGDHETRLRIDVAGYRARRSEALGRFAADVAASVRESGAPRALEPMTSADRKVVHDALND